MTFKSYRVLRGLICSLSILLFISRQSTAQTIPDSLHILFIGNSYTYYHSMPELVKVMAESKFPDLQIETKFVGRGGATLKQQWEFGQASKEIETGKWDYVVLQEQSMLGSAVIENGKRYVGNPEQFFKYARMFDQIITQNGTETIFYMTWSRKDRQDQQKYITYAYMAIAKRLRSKIAPTGIVWDRVREQTVFDLYEKDGSHPSIYGSFLAAIVLFATIFDTKPIGIPGYLRGNEILRGGRLAKKKSVLCNIAYAKAEIIQNAAATIYERTKDNNGYLDVEKAISKRKPSYLSVIIRELSKAEGQAILVLIIAAIFFMIHRSKKITKSSS